MKMYSSNTTPQAGAYTLCRPSLKLMLPKDEDMRGLTKCLESIVLYKHVGSEYSWTSPNPDQSGSQPLCFVLSWKI